MTQTNAPLRIRSVRQSEILTKTVECQDIAVAEVKIHPDYGKTPIGLAINDIMLLKLSTPVLYNEWVKPICLPS